MNAFVCFNISGLDITIWVKSKGWIHPIAPRLQVGWGFGGLATNIRTFSAHLFWVRSSERLNSELDDTGKNNSANMW